MCHTMACWNRVRLSLSPFGLWWTRLYISLPSWCNIKVCPSHVVIGMIVYRNLFLSAVLRLLSFSNYRFFIDPSLLHAANLTFIWTAHPITCIFSYQVPLAISLMVKSSLGIQFSQGIQSFSCASLSFKFLAFHCCWCLCCPPFIPTSHSAYGLQLPLFFDESPILFFV